MGKRKKIIGIFLVATIFAFIAHNLYINWSKLEDFTFQIDFSYLVYSLVFLMIAWIVSVWVLKKLFAAIGHKVSFSDVYVIYFRSILGKYIPGKIWQIAGSTYLAKRRGIPEGVSVMAFVLGQTYSILSGVILIMVVAAFRFSLEPTSIVAESNWKLLPIIIILTVIAVKPKILELPINWILRLLNRNEVIVNFGIKVGFAMLIYYMACWFIFGLSFWMFIKALMPVSFNQYIALTAIHTGAVVVGFLAIFAPGGFGVREGIIVLLLTHIANFQAPVPAIIAIGFRLITSVSELISFGITWGIDKESTTATTIS